MDAEQDEELVSGGENSRNWKGILISVLVILVILGLIIIAVLLRKQDPETASNQKPFVFDDIMDKGYEPKRFTGVWLNDFEFVYQNDTLDILIFNCKTLESRQLVTNNKVKQLVGDKSRFFISNNKKIVLFTYDLKQLYRHSYVARYKILNLESNNTFEVAPADQKESDQIQAGLLSPNGENIAFVQNNNIYIMTDYLKNAPKAIQATTDGQPLTIYNGIADWLYEEEIFYQPIAMFWSPSSKKLAYIQFNDSNVDFYSFKTYDGSQYNHENRVRYPKTGTNNPQVQVYIFDFSSKQTVSLEIPESLKDFYVWNVKWADDNSIIVVYANRRQNSIITCIYSVSSGRIRVSKTYPTLPDSWLSPSGILVSRRHDHYFQIWPNDGYKSIVKFHLTTFTPTMLTNHKFDVTEISHLNEETGMIYYVATNGDSRQRHVFRKHMNADPNSDSECLTCEIKLESDVCKYSAPTFYGTSEHYVLECLGDDVPMIYLKSTKNLTFFVVLERNDELRELVESKILPTREFRTIVVDNVTNATAHVELLFPPKFKADEVEYSYPVLTYVYNGPSSQAVDYQFRVRKYETFICTTFRVIIAIMDGRGTDNNGDKYMKAVYKRLGEFETQDQITLARELKKESFTNNDKFAIWGWSYGGFISAMALITDPEYRCAISGAPVVDWSFYDTAYTERYLGLMHENRQIYEVKSNLTYLAKQNLSALDYKKFLLVHGTGDDNVHFQNSAVLAKVLRQSRMDFEFEVLPDIQHTPDDETQRYLYFKMSRFLMSCFDISPNVYPDFFPPIPVVEPPPKDDDSKS